MKSKKNIFLVGLVLLAFGYFSVRIFSQANSIAAGNFKQTVSNRLKSDYGTRLEKVCSIESNATARRLFSEYGAIFVASAEVALPNKCIYETEADLQNFQVRAESQTATIGGAEITLQKPAMEALLNAQREAARQKLRITPRGGSLAAKRSLQDTINLWNSRLAPGLNYWVGQRKISRSEAAAVKNLPLREQIAKVLEYENAGLFFSKDFSKSILYSVAAPGASQHNFMLALDVEQFADAKVRKILADNGWFQTVKSDLPHFTYLGAPESELPALGLKSVTVGGQKFWIPNL